MSADAKSLESQVKFCQTRVNTVEKHFGLLCQTFASITRKAARMRDKGDLLSQQLMQYADDENISHSSRGGIVKFAQNFAAVQDYRQAEVKRLESKVVKPLSTYGHMCKQVKAGVKSEQKSISKEQKQITKLKKVQSQHPGDAQQIAEAEVQKAQADANIGSQSLDKQMIQFEKNKLDDLKKVLTDFVQVEMLFHAKALEFYARCFENMESVDEEADLEEFGRKLRASRGADWQSMAQAAMSPEGTMSSEGLTTGMSSTMGSSEYTTGTSTGSFGDSMQSTAKRVRIQTGMYDDLDDDDDDDEEDDDDEDEDDEDDDDDSITPARR